MSPAHRSDDVEGDNRMESRSKGGKIDDSDGEVRRGDAGAGESAFRLPSDTVLGKGVIDASLSTLMIVGDGTVTDTAVCIGMLARSRLKEYRRSSCGRRCSGN